MPFTIDPKTGKLVRLTSTAAQKQQGRAISGTLGVISGPKTKQQAARRISEVFNPPAAPEPPVPEPPRPGFSSVTAQQEGKVIIGSSISIPNIPGDPPPFVPQQSGFGLGSAGSGPFSAAVQAGSVLGPLPPSRRLWVNLLRDPLDPSFIAQAAAKAPFSFGLGPKRESLFAPVIEQERVRRVLANTATGSFIGGGGKEFLARQVPEAPEGPRSITSTGPTPIQLGNPAQTLGDISPLFPEGTVIGRAGGTMAAQLPDGRIMDLTRVETYGQIAAESLFRWMDTGNPDMRSTNIREEWAMSFKHLWESEYANVTAFLDAMGYRQVPGTNNWIRENPMDLTSPGSGGGSGGSRVIQGSRGFGGGSFGSSAARGNRSSFGLTQWGITPGA